ncbi:MFS transporter [Burkholderia alba]|uniref:MFS transporter n=1 Tax=Burkholderia alba TaxID=2683677 RepID=UPI002B05DF02|nr:MFS transporter [Burkholderia alba]
MDSSPHASHQFAVTLLLSAVIAATYGFGVYLFPVLLPQMRHDIGFDYTQAGFVTAARQAANVAVALLSGFAAARFGAARVVFIALMLSAAGLGALAFVERTWLMGGVLIALNACAAATWVPMMVLIAPLIDARHQAKAIGVIGSGTNYGVLVNGLMVPALLAAWGWRSVWLASAMLTAALGVVLAAAFARVARSRGGDEPPRRTAHASRRVTRRQVVARRYLLTYAIALLSGFAGVPFVTYLSAYAHDDLRLGLDATAHAWALMGVAGAASGFVLGVIGDFRGASGGRGEGAAPRDGMRAALVSAGVLLLGASVIAAAHPGAAALGIAAFAFGFSFFPIYGLLHAYVGKRSGAALAAVVCGMCEAAFGVGGVAGNLLGGWCRTVAGTFQPVYWLAAAVSVVLVGLMCAMPNAHRGEAADCRGGAADCR